MTTYVTLSVPLFVLLSGNTSYVARTRISDEDIYGNQIPVARSLIGIDASRYSEECPHCHYGISNYWDEEDPKKCLTCNGHGAVFIT